MVSGRYVPSMIQTDWLLPQDTIVGTPGDDTLTGTAGDDRIDGGAGADLMSGGAGYDRYRVDNRGDVVVEQAGQGLDTVFSSVSYALGRNIEDLTLLGSAALHARGNGLDNTLTGNAGNNVMSGEDGDDGLLGGGGNDTLLGGAGADDIFGGTGDDVIDGQDGNDWLSGEAGNDSIRGGDGDDIVYGDTGLSDADGADTCDGGAGFDYYVANWSQQVGAVNVVIDAAPMRTAYSDTFSGFEIYALTFGQGNDTITAGAEGRYDGGAGDDLLTGAFAGALELEGGFGNDTVTGSVGDDTLNGGEGSDLLSGGDGKDYLVTYYNGDDTLDGGAGNDRLSTNIAEWWGVTTMIGGAGKDRFYVETEHATGSVLDFDTTSESILFDGHMTGDKDNDLEWTATVTGPGGFASDAELVVVTGAIDGELTAASAAAAIGSADGAYVNNKSTIFVVNNGVDSGVFRFKSDHIRDADVSAGELHLLVTLVGVTDTTVDNYGLS